MASRRLPGAPGAVPVVTAGDGGHPVARTGPPVDDRDADDDGEHDHSDVVHRTTVDPEGAAAQPLGRLLG